jgi:Na+:H+ antiporter
MILLFIGAVIIINLITRSGFERIGLPVFVGYTLFGFLISLANHYTNNIPESGREGVGFLAQIGLVALLFRVGLESNVKTLLKQIRRASFIWVSDITVSALLAFLTVLYIFEYGLIPAIIVAAAFSATSIGVSTAVWRDSTALASPMGALLVDIAELDDISAIVLFGILLALTPLFQGADDIHVMTIFMREDGAMLIKLAVFVGGCVVFSRYVERAATAWFSRFDREFGSLLFAVGAVLAIAAIADLLGLSLAIGAMFAGLSFGRDPAEKRIDQAFSPIYNLFAPFFFISIGMAVDVMNISGAIGMGVVLLAAAILGKVVCVGLPAALFMGPRQFLLIRISMVPCAEIALLIMGYGLSLGAWAPPPALFNAVVFVSLATCILSTIAVRRMLQTSLLTQIEIPR